jgi:hypothetical protein
MTTIHFLLAEKIKKDIVLMIGALSDARLSIVKLPSKK